MGHTVQAPPGPTIMKSVIALGIKTTPGFINCIVDSIRLENKLSTLQGKRIRTRRTTEDAFARQAWHRA